MGRKEIIDTIAKLSRSQGFYGRLLMSILQAEQDDPDSYNAYMEELENQNFRSTLELVVYLEG